MRHDITVDLKKFGVPSSILESSIINHRHSGPMAQRGMSESRIRLPSTGPRLLWRCMPASLVPEVGVREHEGAYTITFKQSAGITNPIVAGPESATVVIKDGDSAGDHTDDLRVVIQSKVKLSKRLPAPVGTAVTVSGRRPPRQAEPRFSWWLGVPIRAKTPLPTRRFCKRPTRTPRRMIGEEKTTSAWDNASNRHRRQGFC